MKRLLALSLLLAAGIAAADDYPSRPVRIVVPLSPGGFADTPTRILTPKLSEQFGKQFFVENRPGMSGPRSLRRIGLWPSNSGWKAL